MGKDGYPIMKKITMTSVVALAIAMPSYGETTNTSSTFPSNGQMAEDTTYTNQAIYANLHSYTGPVGATANYSDVNYTVNAGQYLPADSEEVAECTAGNFCPGLQSTVLYSETLNQGLNACPTGYPNSLAGATANSECYTACTVANANIAHATAVSGNDYYGTGTDTCVPTACDNGYHLNSGNPNLTEIIGVTEGGSDYGYKSNDGTSNYNNTPYSITQNGEFVVVYGYGHHDASKGAIHGYARCSTQVGDSNNGTWTNPTVSNTLPDSIGQNCYCQLDGYTPLNGTMQSLSAPWVFYGDLNDAGYCAFSCANNCASGLWSDSPGSLAFRSAVFGLLGASAPSCDANVISITWDGADAADIAENDAGTVTYGGDIRTPKKARHIKGKTFVGWTFNVQ